VVDVVVVVVVTGFVYAPRSVAAGNTSIAPADFAVAGMDLRARAVVGVTAVKVV
jgi:hypothetical protein